MADRATNNLLRWGVENSDAAQTGDAPTPPRTQLDMAALQAFFGGGPSEAEQMRNAMKAIQSDEATAEQKRTAWEDLEMLLESIDNANNLEALKLWMPLAELLEHDDAEMRKYAAWCCGTAVQNNIRSQERILVLGAIPTLVRLATEDANPEVRRKAIRAISSTIRNFQPGLDAVLSHMPAEHAPEGALDAGDMDSLDSWMAKLRANA